MAGFAIGVIVVVLIMYGCVSFAEQAHLTVKDICNDFAKRIPLRSKSQNSNDPVVRIYVTTTIGENLDDDMEYEYVQICYTVRSRRVPIAYTTSNVLNETVENATVAMTMLKDDGGWFSEDEINGVQTGDINGIGDHSGDNNTSLWITLTIAGMSIAVVGVIILGPKYMKRFVDCIHGNKKRGSSLHQITNDSDDNHRYLYGGWDDTSYGEPTEMTTKRMDPFPLSIGNLSAKTPVQPSPHSDIQLTSKEDESNLPTAPETEPENTEMMLNDFSGNDEMNVNEANDETVNRRDANSSKRERFNSPTGVFRVAKGIQDERETMTLPVCNGVPSFHCDAVLHRQPTQDSPSRTIRDNDSITLSISDE